LMRCSFGTLMTRVSISVLCCASGWTWLDRCNMF
jgi:hypothetical protein